MKKILLLVGIICGFVSFSFAQESDSKVDLTKSSNFMSGMNVDMHKMMLEKMDMIKKMKGQMMSGMNMSGMKMDMKDMMDHMKGQMMSGMNMSGMKMDMHKMMLDKMDMIKKMKGQAMSGMNMSGMKMDMKGMMDKSKGMIKKVKNLDDNIKKRFDQKINLLSGDAKIEFIKKLSDKVDLAIQKVESSKVYSNVKKVNLIGVLESIKEYLNSQLTDGGTEQSSIIDEILSN